MNLVGPRPIELSDRMQLTLLFSTRAHQEQSYWKSLKLRRVTCRVRVTVRASGNVRVRLG